MAAISDGAIATAARAAGLPADKVATAVAIALAESSGDPTKYNGKGLDNSYGLWQINMIGDMGPARRKQFGLESNDQLFNPDVNARAMVAISSKGSNWTPWTTYTRGTYRQYLTRGNRAALSIAGVNPSPVDGSTTTPVGLSEGLDSITKFFRNLMDSRFWIRMGLLSLGAGLALYGLLKVTGDNQLSEGSKSLGKMAIGLLPGGGTVMQATKAVAGGTKRMGKGLTK